MANLGLFECLILFFLAIILYSFHLGYFAEKRFTTLFALVLTVALLVLKIVYNRIRMNERRIEDLENHNYLPEQRKITGYFTPKTL